MYRRDFPYGQVQSYRARHQRRKGIQFGSVFDDDVSLINETGNSAKLRRRTARSSRIVVSQPEEIEKKTSQSKWAILRERRMEILELNENYKPKNIQNQLRYLVTLMSKRQNQIGTLNDRNVSIDDEFNDFAINEDLSSKLNRNRWAALKRIPPEQMVYMDFEDLSFEIPARSFFLTITSEQENTKISRFCPPAISDMLIDLSKTKIIDDNKQYKRVQLRMRVAKFFFFTLYAILITMVLILILGLSNSLLRFESKNLTSYRNSFNKTRFQTKSNVSHGL